MSKGKLIIFSAPSGCGKGTMLEKIVEQGRFWVSVSATTRSPREGEVDGVNYFFITKENFEKKIAENGFLEYAQYCDNYYGTPLDEVEKHLEAGVNVILEIEVKGALKVKEKRPDAVMIFVLPPSISELRRRLKKRGTEADEVIEKRVAEAVEEIKKAPEYKYVIVNDALEDAVDDFFSVMTAESLTAESQKKFINEVLENA